MPRSRNNASDGEHDAGADVPGRLTEYDAFPILLAEIWIDTSFNCREHITADSVKEMAESIREKLLTPIIVQPIEDAPNKQKAPAGKKYRLLAGFRRASAAMLLGWTEIASRVVSGLSHHEAQVINLRENLDRENLTIVEEAYAIRRLWPQGATLKVMSETLKKDIRWVRARVVLLKMPAKVIDYAKKGYFSRLDIEELATVKDPAQQVEAAKTLVECKRTGKSKPGINGKSPAWMRIRKKKAEIIRMNERMLKAGITGLAPMALAWASGGMPDEELIAAIEKGDKRD